MMVFHTEKQKKSNIQLDHLKHNKINKNDKLTRKGTCIEVLKKQ